MRKLLTWAIPAMASTLWPAVASACVNAPGPNSCFAVPILPVGVLLNPSTGTVGNAGPASAGGNGTNAVSVPTGLTPGTVTVATAAAVADPGSSVQTSTTHSLEAVRKRREEEQQSCPAGLERRNGECVRRAAKPRALVFTKAPVLPVAFEPTWKAWTDGFGDYEYHSNVSPGSAIDPSRKTVTAGTLGGVDVTFRNIGVPGDGLTVGLLAGYEAMKITYSNLASSVDASGPMAGAYAAYYNGAFSTDVLLKADLLSLSQTLPDASALGTIPFDNYTVAGNLTYRFQEGPNIWIEPTAGFRYTQTWYGGLPSAFGIANGSDTRLQAGMRAGGSYTWNGVVVTPSITGLAYDDVSIQGLVAADGVNGAPATALPADQGKVRGEVILASIFDYGNGFSWFGQIDVRGGQDLFGAGGRLGFQYVWGATPVARPAVYTKAASAATSWTGFYAGLSAGGRFDRAAWNTQTVGLGLAPIGESSSQFNGSSFRSGPYFGYNFQASPNFVWGAEGDIAWGNGRNKQFGIPGTFDAAVTPASVIANDTSIVQANWDATVRLRSGFLVTPSVLLYGTGGLALQDVAASAVCASVSAPAGGAWCVTSKGDFASKVLPGWTVGAGVEGKLRDHWLARAEYRYAEFRAMNYSFFAQQTPVDTVNTRIPMQTQTALVGLAYLFN